MWYLTELRPSGQASPTYWLGGTSAGGRTIGRKHVDIRLSASSVSRTHARINILKSAFYTPSVRRHSTSVSVQDSSAYGTFLKYPPGHTSNRGEVVRHHRRLDKDTPTDVCEGALLAFGAPSAWWKVGWLRIAVCPTRLSPQESSRLDDISAATSLEVVSTWSDEITHLITTKCVPTSFKFLTAVAFDRHVVTLAWAEAVNRIVTEACKVAMEASTDQAAIAETNLPDEKLFMPPLAPCDNVKLSRDGVATSLEASSRIRRKEMFENIIFAFAREDRRSKWALIINQLGGQVMIARAVRNRSELGRVVFVHEDGKGAEVENNKPWLAESAVIESILAADLKPLQEGLDSQCAAEVTDVATPGPLDAESDVESEVSDGSQAGGDDAQVEAVTRAEEPDTEGPGRKILGSKRTRPQNDLPMKRVRGMGLEQKTSPPERIEPQQNTVMGPAIPDDTGRNMTAEAENADINRRTFFKVLDPAILSSGNTGAQEVMDVRPFRKNFAPPASKVLLKRVSAFEGAETTSYTRKGSDTQKAESHPRGGSGTGAHLIDSDDE